MKSKINNKSQPQPQAINQFAMWERMIGELNSHFESFVIYATWRDAEMTMRRKKSFGGSATSCLGMAQHLKTKMLRELQDRDGER